MGRNKFEYQMIQIQKFWTFEFRISILPFDLAQGGESFDSAQDREPVERPVEPFQIS